jgi:hypothetical protein
LVLTKHALLDFLGIARTQLLKLFSSFSKHY